MPNDGQAGVITPAPETVPANTVPAAPETPAPEATPEPIRTFTQSELDAAIEKRLSKERRKRQEIETRLKVTEELALKRPEPPKPEARAGEPKREDYSDYQEYIRADARWNAKQEAEKAFAEHTKNSQAESQKADADKQREAFRARVSTLAKDLTDFDEVMAEATSDQDSPVSRLHSEPISACDNPAAVLYHLAKNPDEAERIASLPGQKQAREIWALDTKLKSTPTKKPSNAPAPIVPLGGKGQTASDEPDAKDTKAWVAWRERQVQAKRKGT